MLKRHRFLLVAIIAVLALTIGASTILAQGPYWFYKRIVGPSEVYVREYNEWNLYIKISGDGLSDLVVTDVIPRQLELIGYTANNGTVSVNECGWLGTRITWTIDGPIPNSGEYTTLVMAVATRCYCGGRLCGFLFPGRRYLNKGAHMEGLRDGLPWCDDTDGITVRVLPKRRWCKPWWMR